MRDKAMFRIGEFARVTQVSIRSLRYYDEIGLLKPAHIDSASGYRHYSVAQIPRLNRILALKNLGLSLEQIKQLLDDNITPQEIRGMLILKKKQLEQTIQEEQVKLQLVESRLLELEAEGQLSTYAPVLKTIPEQRYLACRETAPNDDSMSTLIFNSVRAIFNQANRMELSAAVFYDEVFDTIEIDWAFGFLVGDDAPRRLAMEDGRFLEHSVLPAVEEMITVVHHGYWRDLYRGYIALGRWMSANDYEFAGNAREIFLSFNAPPNLEQNITEIQFPVQPIR